MTTTGDAFRPMPSTRQERLTVLVALVVLAVILGSLAKALALVITAAAVHVILRVWGR